MFFDRCILSWALECNLILWLLVPESGLYDRKLCWMFTIATSQFLQLLRLHARSTYGSRAQSEHHLNEVAFCERLSANALLCFAACGIVAMLIAFTQTFRL